MTYKLSQEEKQPGTIATTKLKAILDDIRVGGEATARAYAQKFDGWENEIVVGADAIERAKPQFRYTVKSNSFLSSYQSMWFYR